MSANKTSDTRDSSMTPKTDLDDPQQKDGDNRRNNASGYSWWKWRRSTDSADKKSPPKELEGKELRQSVERTDDMKEVINDLENLNLDYSNDADADADVNAMAKHIEPPSELVQNLSVDNVDATAKNDDSISSELADVSKSSFCSEKYRKTLRLTSDQIVSIIIRFVTHFLRINFTY